MPSSDAAYAFVHSFIVDVDTLLSPPKGSPSPHQEGENGAFPKMLLSTSLPPEKRPNAAAEAINDRRGRNLGKVCLNGQNGRNDKNGQNGHNGPDFESGDDDERKERPLNKPSAFTSTALNGRGGNLRGAREKGAPSEQGNELRNLGIGGIGGGGGRPSELSLLLRKANQGRKEGGRKGRAGRSSRNPICVQFSAKRGD